MNRKIKFQYKRFEDYQTKTVYVYVEETKVKGEQNCIRVKDYGVTVTEMDNHVFCLSSDVRNMTIGKKADWRKGLKIAEMVLKFHNEKKEQENTLEQRFENYLFFKNNLTVLRLQIDSLWISAFTATQPDSEMFSRVDKLDDYPRMCNYERKDVWMASIRTAEIEKFLVV